MAKITLCAFSDEASKSFEGQVAALKRNDIPYMEMRKIDGKTVTKLTLDEAAEYQKRLADCGIAVWSLGSPIGKSEITGDFSEVCEVLKHACEIAHALHTDKIRMFSFHHADGERNEVLERLNKMVEIAAQFEVGLYHENEKGIYGDIATRVKDIMDHVPGLYHVYDPANFLQVGERAEDTLRLFHHRADYFHIKDVIAATGELVPAGHGDGSIRELAARITEDKVLTIEPHLAIFDGYAQIDDSQMKHKFHFTSNDEAFDAAVNAMKGILLDCGYTAVAGGFVK